MWPMTSYVWNFCSSWIGGHTCKVSPRSVQPLQRRRFLKVKKNNGCQIMWPMMSLIFFLWTILSLDDPQKFSYWSDVAFYIWNYDVVTRAPMTSEKIKLIPHEEYLLCAKFQFFLWYGFRDIEVQSFSVFPLWLPHHVTYDVIIIMKTFHTSSCSDGENLVAIQPEVVEKNTKVLCGQTNKHTSRQATMARSYHPFIQRRRELKIF